MTNPIATLDTIHTILESALICVNEAIQSGKPLDVERGAGSALWRTVDAAGLLATIVGFKSDASGIRSTGRGFSIRQEPLPPQADEDVAPQAEAQESAPQAPEKPAYVSHEVERGIRTLLGDQTDLVEAYRLGDVVSIVTVQKTPWAHEGKLYRWKTAYVGDLLKTKTLHELEAIDEHDEGGDYLTRKKAIRDSRKCLRPTVELEAGERIDVWANQAKRDAVVLGVLGLYAVVEYEMPSGSTSLRVVGRHGRTLSAGWISKLAEKSISYKSCPRKWRAAIANGVGGWQGNGQTGDVAFPGA